LLVALDAAPVHAGVRDLASFLQRGDLVVVNNTRVIPARIPVQRRSGGSGEVLLLEERSEGWWEALCRPARKLSAGDVVEATLGQLRITVGDDLGAGRKLVRPEVSGTPELLESLATAGEMPLPPYIHGYMGDPERYQTAFADVPRSAAAPTAGLHFTEDLFASLEAIGVGVAEVELVVGLDTFRPITAEVLDDHEIHTEYYSVPNAVWERCLETRAAGHRVLAVGTTSVRALESVGAGKGLAGRTDLFIKPGFKFSVVDLLMTNFHLPKSSLLALVEAFRGPDWRDLYALAVAERYRFLSFGDAMLLAPRLRPSGLGPSGSGASGGTA
jgi:S-adenosylmethionine:tRNA ribosyltransferase-isomerase